MLCPVCATEMNNSPKCPFCGHVCSPDEDNTVTLNGEVISKGHRNHWCQTTDDKHLAGKMVDGTHYHSQEPYATGQGVSFNGDLIPHNSNQGIPNQEITYTWSPKSGMQMSGSGDEIQRQKAYKTARWILIIFLLFGWGLPFLLFILSFIIGIID
ncbi:MAG: hypothetical protein K2J95_05000 [Lachnospiraceae bacterium]|nr:hypothetical protein [Lachnospiraceae bacterium]